MNPFSYRAAASVAQALDARGAAGGLNDSAAAVRFIAGGTQLLDLMKLRVVQTAGLVDINALPLRAIEPTHCGGLMLGALARNADTAGHPLVRARYPLLAAAILAGASPQLRNMASNGGNLLQRTRCLYFRNPDAACNKRQPGSGCAAVGGIHRQHAVLGASAQCVATHPSDLCVALAALDATVHVEGPAGAREIAFSAFHRLPGEEPQRDNTLADDELITAIELPPRGFAGHSSYLKLRDRQSYAFALVSVAAAVELAPDGRIETLRVALGGVAHKPWREPEAESRTIGALPTLDTFEQLATELLAPARGLGMNDFKIPMARRAVVRALQTAAT